MWPRPLLPLSNNNDPFCHTNQIIGTGFAPTASYLDELRHIDIDRRMNRFGYNELVVSMELGFPGDTIKDPDDWVLQSLHHVQEIAPYLTAKSTEI